MKRYRVKLENKIIKQNRLSFTINNIKYLTLFINQHFLNIFFYIYVFLNIFFFFLCMAMNSSQMKRINVMSLPRNVLATKIKLSVYKIISVSENQRKGVSVALQLDKGGV